MVVTSIESPPVPMVLRSLLDTYGYTSGIKDGSVASPRIAFEFDEVRPVFDAFPRTVRGMEFHVSELATATYLQAHAVGKPLLLLPVGVLSRFHHASVIHHVDRGVRSPADLAGRRVAVRSYMQTTVVWTRGILQTEYGLDPATVTWVTMEDGHLSEFLEPPNAVRAAPGKSIASMLLTGEVDAAIVGRERPNDPLVQELIPDSAHAEHEWYERTGVLPINHMLVVQRGLVDEHPWLIDELYALFRRCRAGYLEELATLGGTTTDDRFRRGLLERGIDPVPFGVEAVRPALEMMVEFCVAQGLIPRGFTIDELFDPRVAILE